MEFISLIFLIIGVSFFAGKFLERFSLPKVIAPIIFGIVVSYYRGFFDITHYDALESLSDLAMIMLLFYIGLELNIKGIRNQGRQTISTAVLGFFITFILGFILSFYLLGFSFAASFAISAILSVTAESIVILILEQAGLVKTKTGEVIIGAGLIDDILGIISLALISIFISSQVFSLSSLLPLFLGTVVFVLGYIFLVRISNFIDDIFLEKKLKIYDVFSLSIILLLFFALVTDYVGFDFSLGAIFAGIFLNYSLNRRGKAGLIEEETIDNFIKNITFGFLSYFFFFWIGFNLDIGEIFKNPLLGFIFAIVAFNGKFFASLLSSYLLKGKFKNSSLVGIGMATKGGVELIILEVARKAGLIDMQTYSALVFMSLLLTILSPIIFNIFVKSKLKSGEVYN